jgi:mRNA interferase MazF
VWLADLPGDKVRPILVMARTAVIRHLHSVIAAPVTSTIRSIPSEVTLGSAEGLRHDSVANFDNTQLVAKALLIQKIGVLGEAKLAAACRALAQATGCGAS